MQDARKAVWSIPYVSVAFFSSLKQNLIAYCSSKMSSRPDCIFEIHQLWQSGISRVYSNCCCSCSFEPEIIKSNQSCHKMCRNNIVNFQESMTILNAYTKKSGNLLNASRISVIPIHNDNLQTYLIYIWESNIYYHSSQSNGEKDFLQIAQIFRIWTSRLNGIKCHDLFLWWGCFCMRYCHVVKTSSIERACWLRFL